MLNKFKMNKYFILSMVLVFILICISFFQFYRENFSYVKDYNIIKENCYEGKNPNHKYCEEFKERKHLEEYISIFNPKKRYKRYNALTLTFEIVEHTVFCTLQYFSPLIIALAVIGSVHSQFSSGMFENYLLRENYSKYLKKTYKIAIKGALIMPLALILIFIMSSIFSGFNFDISNVDSTLAVYSKFKYENFFLYGTMICLIQFFISLFYANISLYCSIKNKNKLVAIIMSYVIFIILDIVIYAFVYAVILNKILGLKGMTDYFNIAGFWFFNENSNCYMPLLVSILLALISFILIRKLFKTKEKVILSYEKQMA